MRIDIDFITGSHGNFLEFVLNRLVLGDRVKLESPFGLNGSSHYKPKSYMENKIFYVGHWFSNGGPKSDSVISISFSKNDLLPLMTVSLLRGADLGILDKDLHINTFNKLNNQYYYSIIENLNKNYKVNLSKENVNCPKYILREFFKFGFKDTELNGFLVNQKQMIYREDQRVYYFPFSSFYDVDLFLSELEKIKLFFNLTYVITEIDGLYKEFIKQQPQIVYKKQCDQILEDIKHQRSVDIPSLSLFQESYLNAQLELVYNIEMPFVQEEYFTNTQEILEYLNEI